MKIIKISHQNRMLIVSFLFLTITYIVFAPKKEDGTTIKKDRIYADTLIPQGYVLVPIELANADSVSALMDQYGVVDLYSGSVSTKGNKKIASKVKIMRAPLNPNQYAVLVPDELSNMIMSTPGPFWAVVQNHETKQGKIFNKKIQTIRIEYHQGET